MFSMYASPRQVVFWVVRILSVLGFLLGDLQVTELHCTAQTLACNVDSGLVNQPYEEEDLQLTWRV